MNKELVIPSGVFVVKTFRVPNPSPVSDSVPGLDKTWDERRMFVMNLCHPVSQVNHFLLITGSSILVNHAVHFWQCENLQIVGLGFNLSFRIN